MNDTFLFLLILVSATACAESANVSLPEPVAVVVPETKPAEPEKATEPVEKMACIQVWDSKQNKEVKKCRKLKIHQKHEGTVVPAK